MNKLHNKNRSIESSSNSNSYNLRPKIFYPSNCSNCELEDFGEISIKEEELEDYNMAPELNLKRKLEQEEQEEENLPPNDFTSELRTPRIILKRCIVGGAPPQEDGPSSPPPSSSPSPPRLEIDERPCPTPHPSPETHYSDAEDIPSPAYEPHPIELTIRAPTPWRQSPSQLPPSPPQQVMPQQVYYSPASPMVTLPMDFSPSSPASSVDEGKKKKRGDRPTKRDLEISVGILREQLTKTEKDANDQKQLVIVCQSKLGEVCKKNEEIESKLKNMENFESRMIKLQTQNETLVNENKELIAQLDQTCGNFRQLTGVEEENEHLKFMVADLNSKKKVLEEKVLDLQSKNDNLSKNNAFLHDQNQKLTTCEIELEECIGKLNRSNEYIDHYRGEIYNLQSTLEDKIGECNFHYQQSINEGKQKETLIQTLNIVNNLVTK